MSSLIESTKLAKQLIKSGQSKKSFPVTLKAVIGMDSVKRGQFKIALKNRQDAIDSGEKPVRGIPGRPRTAPTPFVPSRPGPSRPPGATLKRRPATKGKKPFKTLKNIESVSSKKGKGKGKKK